VDIEARIKDLEERLAALKAEVEQEKEGPWKPKCGERYFFVSTTNEIGTYYCGNEHIDREHFDCGNFFRTQEEAEQWATWLRIAFKMRKPGATGGMWEVVIMPALERSSLYSDNLYVAPRFPTKEAAEHAAKQLTPDEIKFLREYCGGEK
jgi:hypothetical protein